MCPIQFYLKFFEQTRGIICRVDPKNNKERRPIQVQNRSSIDSDGALSSWVLTITTKENTYVENVSCGFLVGVEIF